MLLCNFMLNIEKKRLRFWECFLHNLKIDVHSIFIRGPQPFKNCHKGIHEKIAYDLIDELDSI